MNQGNWQRIGAGGGNGDFSTWTERNLETGEERVVTKRGDSIEYKSACFTIRHEALIGTQKTQ